MFESLAEKLKKRNMKKTEDTEVTFKPYEEIESVSAPVTEPVYEEQMQKKSATSMVADGSDSNIELKVVRPASFEEVSDIADHLLEGCTVVLNLELLDMPSTMRMLDFLNGVTYSTGGDIKNVSKTTYIITPHNVDVSND